MLRWVFLEEREPQSIAHPEASRLSLSHKGAPMSAGRPGGREDAK